MIPILTRRLVGSALLVLAVVTAAFLAVHLLPGSPLLLLGGHRAAPDAALRLRETFGLDAPLLEQYLRWLVAACRGEWGRSISNGSAVGGYLLEGLKNSFALALPALLVQLSCGIGLGMLAARRPGGRLDLSIRGGLVAVYALPVFLVGHLAQQLVAYRWGLLPADGMHRPGAGLSGLEGLVDLARHTALPALVLGLALAAHTARLVRNHLLDALAEDYVRTALAKGASRWRVEWVHALANVFVPITQSVGMTLALLASGSVIVETIFAWPGLGRRIYLAVGSQDYPVVLAGTALTAVLMIAGSLTADLLHLAADPRVRRA